MPNYRRPVVPGATVFLTIATHLRVPYFANPEHVAVLRRVIAQVKTERPFTITAAVVLHDHLHFLWTLPPDDADFSRRVGRMKVLVTQALRPTISPENVSPSRRKHREGTVWQRRFWDHVVRDEDDLERHMDYIHFNPVKHGYVACPHARPWSSFHRWVERGAYDLKWGCGCGERRNEVSEFARTGTVVGE
jgi:putative transposase